MPPSPTLKRLALAAALSGAAIAATPALANAASTCTYTPDAFPLARVDVFDGSGSQPLRIHRKDQFIAITDAGGTKLCGGPAGSFATRFNTDRIVVHGTATAAEGSPFIVDQSAGTLAPGGIPESDGNSEIETIINNNGVPTSLWVLGTGAPDIMRVSDHSGVMLGSDNDVDIRESDATFVFLNGLGGSDFLSGRGGYPASSPAPATTLVSEFGGDGDDTLVDGPQFLDQLGGGPGNDTLFTVDGQQDHVFGGPDFDTATVDKNDLQDDALERVILGSVGRMKLDRTVVSARAGRAARLTLAWKHPESWKQLRSLELIANDAGTAVGSIRIDAARGRITERGSLRASKGSTVAHHGKWVTARIWLRPAKRLAGDTLRLAVRATDTHGSQQLEPLAGTLTVVK